MSFGDGVCSLGGFVSFLDGASALWFVSLQAFFVGGLDFCDRLLAGLWQGFPFSYFLQSFRLLLFGGRLGDSPSSPHKL